MSRLQFDTESHTYRVDGVVYPGVTNIIKMISPTFGGVAGVVLEYARGRGQAVHKACEIFNLAQIASGGKVFECFAEPLDPVIEPYFFAWTKFIREKRVTITSAERQLYHPALKYAGTYDAEGTMEGTDTDSWTFDIKAVASLSPATGVQLAAYQELRSKSTPPTRGPYPNYRRAAVQLKPDGTYVFQEYKSISDWPTFVSCMNVYNFKANNKIT